MVNRQFGVLARIPVFTGWEVDRFIHAFMFAVKYKRGVAGRDQVGDVEVQPGSDICIIDQLAIHRIGTVETPLRTRCLPVATRLGLAPGSCGRSGEMPAT